MISKLTVAQATVIDIEIYVLKPNKYVWILSSSSYICWFILHIYIKDDEIVS